MLLLVDKMPVTKGPKCGVCDNPVGKSKGSFMCCKCKLWFHPACAKVPENLLPLLDKTSSIAFTCLTCFNASSNDCDLIGDEVRALANSFNNFVKSNQESRDSFEASMSKILSDFKNEVSNCLDTMKTDLINCNKLVNKLEDSTSAKIDALKMENDILHRRLNRADIMVSGLPAGLENLSSTIISLCSFFDIDISSKDIYHACYLNNKRLILVKFNNVSIRDQIMKEYFKSRSLKVFDVIGGDINTRVYLNDHFSPAASNLNLLCR